jgi:gas vesicle protein
MSRDNAAGDVIFFLLGAAVGAAAGVLLAPKSGKETREQLGDWLKERRERSKELLAELKHAVPEKKEAFAAAVKAGKDAYRAATSNHAEKETVNA